MGVKMIVPRRFEKLQRGITCRGRQCVRRTKPILRIIKTLLEDKDVCGRRLREGCEFFKRRKQRRSDLAAAQAATG